MKKLALVALSVLSVGSTIIEAAEKEFPFGASEHGMEENSTSFQMLIPESINDMIIENEDEKFLSDISEQSKTGNEVGSRIPIRVPELANDMIMEPHFGEKSISLGALRNAGVNVDDTSLSIEERNNAKNATAYDPAAELDKKKGLVQGTLGDNYQNLPNTIIGQDTREPADTNSYRGRLTALIEFNNGGEVEYCSGTLIGHNTVVTAGHCLYRRDSRNKHRGSVSRNVKVFPGANGSIRPYRCAARKFGGLYVPRKWISFSEGYDYGIIKLDCNIGYQLGWAGVTLGWHAGEAIRIHGYPVDRDLTQSSSKDWVRQQTPHQLFYHNDTNLGMSGGGVWFGNDGSTLIGIHGYGTHGYGKWWVNWKHKYYNHGVSINNSVLKNLRYVANLR